MSNSPTAYFQKLTFHLLLPQHPQKKLPYCYYFFTSPGSPDVDEGIAWLRVDFKSYRLKPECFFFFIPPLASRKCTRTHAHAHTQISFNCEHDERYLLTFTTAPPQWNFSSPHTLGRVCVRSPCACCSPQHMLHRNCPFPLLFPHENGICVSAETQTALPPWPRTAGGTGMCSVNAC